MNDYASKVESSYKIAKDEITRLTIMFKYAFHTNSFTVNTNQTTPDMFHTNPNNIKNPIVVRTQGSCHARSRVNEKRN